MNGQTSASAGTRETDKTSKIWERTAQACSGLLRLLVLTAMFAGAFVTLSTFRELIAGFENPKTVSTKQHIVVTPTGEVSTSTSGILKLMIGPSTNSVSLSEKEESPLSDVLLLPVERIERRPVVLPFIASLAACVTLLCVITWSIVRISRED